MNNVIGIKDINYGEQFIILTNLFKYSDEYRKKKKIY